MLRRPPTTLTLTAEDVAAYEDRRFALQNQSQAQSQAETISRAPSHPTQSLQQTQTTEMDTSSSPVTPSSPPANAEDDEDMRDADADEADTSDPFITAPRRAVREQLHGRSQSPGQVRAAYLQQMRATRSQHAATNSTSTTASSTTTGPSTRMQRITGATQQPSTATTRGGAGTRATNASRQGSTEPAAPSGPATRQIMTRSREERIGIAGPTTGGGAGSRIGSRRR